MCYQTKMQLIFVMYFSDIVDSVADLFRKMVSKIENPAPLGSTRIIYLGFFAWDMTIFTFPTRPHSVPYMYVICEYQITIGPSQVSQYYRIEIGVSNQNMTCEILNYMECKH